MSVRLHVLDALVLPCERLNVHYDGIVKIGRGLRSGIMIVRFLYWTPSPSLADLHILRKLLHRIK